MPSHESDPAMHKEVEKLIENNLLRTPAESIFQFTRSGSGIHINIVKLPGTAGRMFLIASNTDGKVDIIEKG